MEKMLKEILKIGKENLWLQMLLKETMIIIISGRRLSYLTIVITQLGNQNHT